MTEKNLTGSCWHCAHRSMLATGTATEAKPFETKTELMRLSSIWFVRPHVEISLTLLANARNLPFGL